MGPFLFLRLFAYTWEKHREGMALAVPHFRLLITVILSEAHRSPATERESKAPRAPSLLAAISTNFYHVPRDGRVAQPFAVLRRLGSVIMTSISLYEDVCLIDKRVASDCGCLTHRALCDVGFSSQAHQQRGHSQGPSSPLV
jgi:hypothetical protein